MIFIIRSMSVGVRYTPPHLRRVKTASFFQQLADVMQTLNGFKGYYALKTRIRSLVSVSNQLNCVRSCLHGSVWTTTFIYSDAKRLLSASWLYFIRYQFAGYLFGRIYHVAFVDRITCQHLYGRKARICKCLNLYYHFLLLPYCSSISVVAANNFKLFVYLCLCMHNSRLFLVNFCTYIMIRNLLYRYSIHKYRHIRVCYKCIKVIIIIVAFE